MSDWFDSVTGTNDYERQSWRDSYNGGRAAGDLTGNTNARLDAEREAFQGATWSGSSSQYSALELAERQAGQGQAVAATGAGSPQSAGPGNETVAQGPVSPGRPAGGSGPGSRLTVALPTGYDVGVADQFRYTPIGFGLTWASPADFAMGQDLEDEMGEIGSVPFQLGKIVTEVGLNAERVGRWAGPVVRSGSGATPSTFVDPDPIYADGWVSYDERQTWEKAPKGSPADQYWSF